jgi:leucyl aminopeptidase
VEVQATQDEPLATDADTVVLGLVAGVDPTPLGALGQAADRLLDAGEARTAWHHLAHTHIDGRRLVLIGLGDGDELDAERARQAAAHVLRRLRELGAASVAWVMPGGSGSELAEAIVQGTLLGAYRFDRFRSRSEDDDEDDGTDGGDRNGGGGRGRGRLPRRLIICAPDDLSAPVARAALVARAQNRARDLGNRPPNDLTPARLAEYAQALGDEHPGLEVEVLDENEIIELGMGAFAAVASASAEPAKLIVLRWEGGEVSAAGGRSGAGVADLGERRLALIGKAVTFDSGGLWVKPGMSMPEMKFDMMGGAAVVEAVGALAEMRAPVSLLGLVGATENLVDGAGMRPGDIVTGLDGTTIEINNTDAEGRLVLADCIAYARRQGCAAIVDVATLTGSIVSALGAFHAGLFASDDALAQLIAECAQRTGERVWRMPLHPDYAAMVRGRYAQVSNLTRPRGEAAAITAAEFLHHFAGDAVWAHLDIAGMGHDGRRPYFDKGATGFGVRLLTELALSF